MRLFVVLLGACSERRNELIVIPPLFFCGLGALAAMSGW